MKLLMSVILALAIWTPLFDPETVAAPPVSADNHLQVLLAPLAGQAAERAFGMQADPLTPVARFYREFAYRPVWTDANGLLPRGETLMRVMARASGEGLFAGNHQAPYGRTLPFHRLHLAATPPLPPPPPHLALDVMLSDAILQMARHLAQGRIAPEDLYGHWQAWRRSPQEDIAADLARAVKEDRLVDFVESMHPRNRAYQDLKYALFRYEHIRQAGGWPTVAPGPTLKSGDSGPRVAALRRRLAITGDGTFGPAEPASYDAGVEAAVRRFQIRHGLHVDGLVGERTRNELNVTVNARIAGLKLNMERWRWFPDDLGDRHVLVNIPAFALHVVAHGATVDRMRAIVGRENRPTPVMSARITYLEFNPYWNVPQKIAREDILPRAVRDPGYLSRQGIRVYASWNDQAPELDPSGIPWEAFSDRYFPYRLRQDPSRVNALGRVKFMFPNPRSIYIHDTPSRGLFDRPERDFSSGCVRVETPLTLALHLLQGQGWDRDRLQSAVARGRQRTVLLDEPVPVHLVYFTAWVEEDGRVNFRPDIYGRDRKLLVALTGHASEHQLCASEADIGQPEATCIPAPSRHISTAETPLLGSPASAASGIPTAGL